ncbi:MAG: hypothetical protein ACKOYM_09960, partial [Actinomycetes bacterium]
MGDLPGAVTVADAVPVGGRPLRWAQVPSPRPGGRSWETAMIAWLLTAIPMWVQLRHLQYERQSIVPALVVALIVALACRAHPVLGLAAAAVAAPVIMLRDSLFAGPPVLVLVAVTVLWCVATGAFLPRWRRWPDAPGRRWIVLAMVVVDLTLLFTTGVRQVAAAVALAGLVVLAVLAAPQRAARAGQRFDPVVRVLDGPKRWNRALIERVGHVAGNVVGAIAMLPVAIVTAITWLIQRATRFDPLEPPARRDTRWVLRRSDDAAPDRAFARVALHDPRGSGHALHRALTSFASVVVFAGLFAGAALALGIGQGVVDDVAARVTNDDGRNVVTKANCGDAQNEAMRGQASWPLVGCETTEFALRARFDGATTYRFEDYAGDHVNVRNGIRRTWRAPACGCKRITVWWFGGSAAWGYYQADELTLPSQVARAAWRRGVALDITNYASPGWTLGQDVRKFAQLIATEDPPDYAVFYDGANDVVLQRDRNNNGNGSDESEVSFAEDTLDEVLQNGPFDWGLRAQERGEQRGDEPLLSDVAVVRHAVSRYARNMKIATALARSVGTTPVFLWQPILPSAPRSAGSADAMSEGDETQWAVMVPEIRRRMPKGVV